MKTIRFLILFPVMVGFLAGFAALFDSRSPGASGMSLGGMRKTVFVAGSATILGFVFVPMLGRFTRKAETPPRFGAKVTRARLKLSDLGRGLETVGELTVRASHSIGGRELALPPGSRTETLEKGHLYKITIPNTSLEQVEAIAREHGFTGRIG